jgi:glycosyltransferase involved in cell wall biosynthesis
MRVLILHNRYRAEGGEERAVRETAAMLQAHGHEVTVWERSSEGLGRGRAARALLRGGEAPEEVADRVRELGAEVVHAHNLHPRFGWRALAAAREAGARTVLHLHNFRLYCAVGVAYRNGAPCHACTGPNTVPGVVHRCRGSLGEAAVYAAGLATQQSRILDHADAVLVTSHAHGALLRERHGLPWAGVSVLPNFVREFAAHSRADAGRHALVAGRLVPEKGFDTAISAARGANVPLVIAGSGPDEARLRALAAGVPGITFAGWVPPAELDALRAAAGVVLAPSRCEEACPYSVLEALAAGVPVLGSDRGGIPELVGPAATVPADDAEAWRRALAAQWQDPEGRRSRGEAALSSARVQYGEERHLERLLAVYRA